MLFFDLPDTILRLADQADALVRPAFAHIDAVTEHNQRRVLAAFINNRVSESHFAATTGYGYGDRGREVLDAVFAGALGAEDALVRHSILSGTHAIATGLFGILRPGDAALSATGAPYDTLASVFGITPAAGSLAEFGVGYREIALKQDGAADIPAITAAVRTDPAIKLVYIQRSRGYSARLPLTVRQIGEIAAAVKAVRPDIAVFVDNCYGEFVEKEEPVAVGADLMAGSLIKNPGGGIAGAGGYLCGRKDLIELCAARLTTPGIGREVGATLGLNRSLFMGLFAAPHVTGEAVKTAVFAAALFGLMGYEVSPAYDAGRTDIVQSVTLGDPEKLIAFCQGMQRGAPVDSFVVPQPWDMPGYDTQVIMAAGGFTAGASIELSADAPLREPYAAYIQGGLNFHAAKMGILLAAEGLISD